MAVVAPVSAREALFVACLQARFDDVEVRGGAEQLPRVADHGQQRHADHPGGPEAAVRAHGHPHAYGQRRETEAAAGLLGQATPQPALALGQRELDRARADGQVGAQRVRVGAGGGPVGGADAVLELLGGEAPGQGVLAQLLDELLAVSVGDAQLRDVGHALNVVHEPPGRQSTSHPAASRDVAAGPRAGCTLQGVSDEDAFELAAAGLRGDGTDLRISVEVLASKLEQALPGCTRVKRAGGGLLGRGHQRVRTLAVELAGNRYELELQGTVVQTSRQRQVGGIAIKSEQLAPEEWIVALTGDLQAESERSAEARAALEGLLR
jgi:hypothetical protein